MPCVAARGSTGQTTVAARPATTTTRTTGTTMSVFVAPAFNFAGTPAKRRSPFLPGEKERAYIESRSFSCVGAQKAAERIITC